MRTARWVLLLAALLLGLAAAEAGAEWARVVHVNDGDTLTLADGRLVRYIGIDAPEIDHAGDAAEPLGREAQRRNAELTAAKAVRLEFDQERTDPHGRTLAYVFLPDGRLVNEVLAREGLAVFYYKPPNLRYAERILAAQREAMGARRGLWGRAAEPSGAVIGNASSRRFHRLECPEAKRIRPANRVRFSSREAAFREGYSPSRECHPPVFEPR